MLLQKSYVSDVPLFDQNVMTLEPSYEVVLKNYLHKSPRIILADLTPLAQKPTRKRNRPVVWL